MKTNRPLLVGLAASLVWVGIGQPAARASAAQDAVTLTGCLRTGSAASVIILRGAATPVSGGQMPRDYLLVQVPDGVDVGALMNHRVAVTGAVNTAEEAPAPPDAANSAERALRRITVQGMRDIAANCSDPAS
jgi:hypothetical protein